jgi:thiamine-monophosphate kinase
MADSEFALIQRFFTDQNIKRSDVLLGVGDDCALLQVPPGESLAITTDTLVSGVHFFADTEPESLGHKALAVNLSDLAAMGARPAWVTLALALPEANAHWLNAFSRGFFNLAERFQIQLVGGDTTRGPLTITIQACGFVPNQSALRRDGAAPEDRIYVTGNIGDAALALAATENHWTLPDIHLSHLQTRLTHPTPRIRQGLELRGVASAAIDISDGLAQDLQHILQRSGVGATLEVDQLPRSQALQTSLETDDAIALALTGGDDYELCFTVPLKHQPRLQSLAAHWDCPCTEIGTIEKKLGLRYRRMDNSRFCPPSGTGYDHFA